MKTRGHILVKISSVVFILYGAAALLAFVLSLMSAEAAEEYGLADRLASPYPILSVMFAVLVPLLFVAAGVLNIAEIGTCVLVLLVPVIYVIGAWRNWRQPKSPSARP